MNNGKMLNNISEQGNVYGYWIRFLQWIPRKQLLLSVFFGSVRIVSSTTWPFLLYYTLKDIGKSSTDQMLLLHLVCVGLLLSVAAMAAHLQSNTNIKILKLYTLDLIDKVWKKMQAIDWLTFHGRNRVYYFDMLMVETWRLRSGVGALLESLIINSLIAGGLSLLLVFVSFPLFLVCFSGMLLMGIGHYISMRKTRPFLKQFHTAWRDQHLWIAKSVDQFDLIKLHRGYKDAAVANLRHAAAFVDANSKLLACQAKQRNMNQLLSNIVRIAVFIIGIFWVRMNVVGLDDLLLVLLIVSVIQANIMQLPGALNNFLEAQEAYKTIRDFFTLNEEADKINERAIHNKFPTIQKISIRDLTYSYTGNAVLDKASLNVEKGKVYLWKGKNGSGKSTAAHVVLGLLQPQQGELKINDQVVDWNTLSSMRSRFAFLHQDAPIFMGNIKENALFGHEQPEHAWQQLHSSWLAKLLSPTKHLEKTIVGERGEGLSGGEAKRIVLIREMLRTSDLLILDEPLNHLDEFAINEIKREIVSIKASTIIIIISHQTGFESIADEIITFS